MGLFGADQSPPEDGSALVDLPDEEVTPRVRDKIMALTHELELLRGELNEARKRLEEMARTADQDMLLPILNRRAFVREVSRYLAFAERYGTPSTLLYFDLDNFKGVNDLHGHAAGDAVLKHFAGLLTAQIRDSDILARLGGDEFGIILTHVTLEQAQKKAATLVEALVQNPLLWNGQAVSVSSSFGACELRTGETVDKVLAEADRAMYDQKRAARNPP